jgi:hypothetical protein
VHQEFINNDDEKDYVRFYVFLTNTGKLRAELFAFKILMGVCVGDDGKRAVGLVRAWIYKDIDSVTEKKYPSNEDYIDIRYFKYVDDVYEPCFEIMDMSDMSYLTPGTVFDDIHVIKV